MLKLYSYDEINAALCVWECINEWTLDPDEKIDKWVELRDGVGTLELRHQSIELAQWLLKVHSLCIKDDPDIFDQMSFDWEVVPHILKFAVDADGYPVIYEKDLPNVGNTAGSVKAGILKDNWYAIAYKAGGTCWGHEDLINEHADKTLAAFEQGADPVEFVKDLGHHYGLTPQY
ncbi:hypothetical protein [Pseudochrobactrum asaccharolyticum]|uniref:Uncharacterized protein n=1 Tax=Pseudochrobactrum asaccharolyticum TaxID=354351 RepID=A0A366DK66_9HYPH|nr:hypothetical protein [Pseudochrobactrum asaccharolyticum]RBO90477.1 hypothetical protein DFR47_11338 [Pseudochrobactrum asaccharolyticum]